MIALACASVAHAHGRPPSLQQLLFDPADPNRIIAQATWGVVFSDDGGETWTWTCAAAMGVDARMQDPDLELHPDGRLLAATFEGALTASQSDCQWDAITPLDDTWVIDMAVSGEGVLGIETSGFDADRLWRLDTDTWTPVGEPFNPVLVYDSIIVAPSDPETIYLGGLRPRRAEQERGIFVLASNDGGLTRRETEIGLRGEEYGVNVLGVAPDDADHVWAVVLTFGGEMANERLIYSRDGGRTFETRHTLPQVGGLVLAPGGRVWVGSKLGGLWRSDNQGRSWRKLNDLHVRCLTRRDDELWICTDEAFDGFALGTLDIEGATVRPVLELTTLTQIRPCATCTDVGVVCPAWLPDVVVDLKLDPDEVGIQVPTFEDGGVGLPREVPLPEECGGPPIEKPGDCGCSTPGLSSEPRARWSVWLLVVGYALRRRMKAKPRSASTEGTAAELTPET